MPPLRTSAEEAKYDHDTDVSEVEFCNVTGGGDDAFGEVATVVPGGGSGGGKADSKADIGRRREFGGFREWSCGVE